MWVFKDVLCVNCMWIVDSLRLKDAWTPRGKASLHLSARFKPQMLGRSTNTCKVTDTKTLLDPETACIRLPLQIAALVEQGATLQINTAERYILVNSAKYSFSKAAFDADCFHIQQDTGSLHRKSLVSARFNLVKSNGAQHGESKVKQATIDENKNRNIRKTLLLSPSKVPPKKTKVAHSLAKGADNPRTLKRGVKIQRNYVGDNLSSINQSTAPASNQTSQFGVTKIEQSRFGAQNLQNIRHSNYLGASMNGVAKTDHLSTISLKTDNLATNPITDSLATSHIDDILATSPITDNLATIPINDNLATSHINDNLDTLSHKTDNLDTSHINDNLDTSPITDNLDTSPITDNLDTSHITDNLDTSHINDNLDTISHKTDNLDTISHKTDNLDTITHKTDNVVTIKHTEINLASLDIGQNPTPLHKETTHIIVQNPVAIDSESSNTLHGNESNDPTRTFHFKTIDFKHYTADKLTSVTHPEKILPAIESFDKGPVISAHFTPLIYSSDVVLTRENLDVVTDALVPPEFTEIKASIFTSYNSMPNTHYDGVERNNAAMELDIATGTSIVCMDDNRYKKKCVDPLYPDATKTGADTLVIKAEECAGDNEDEIFGERNSIEITLAEPINDKVDVLTHNEQHIPQIQMDSPRLFGSLNESLGDGEWIPSVNSAQENMPADLTHAQDDKLIIQKEVLVLKRCVADNSPIENIPDIQINAARKFCTVSNIEASDYLAIEIRRRFGEQMDIYNKIQEFKIVVEKIRKEAIKNPEAEFIHGYTRNSLLETSKKLVYEYNEAKIDIELLDPKLKNKT